MFIRRKGVLKEIDIDESNRYLCSENCNYYRMTTVYYENSDLYYDGDDNKRDDVPMCAICDMGSEYLIPYNKEKYVRDIDCIHAEIVPAPVYHPLIIEACRKMEERFKDIMGESE